METDAVPADAKQPSVTALPAELVQKILELVGPRTVKRFGQTCRRYHKIARNYESSLIYAGSFVHRALARFTTILLEAHIRRNRGGCYSDHFMAKAMAYVLHVATILAGCPERPISSWEGVNYLRFLYRVALNLTDWSFAPYALEWCARHERDILGVSKMGPRPEILALLSNNAVGQLAAMTHVSEKTLILQTHDIFTSSVFSLACRCHEAGGRVTFRIASIAATTAYLLIRRHPNMPAPTRTMMDIRLSAVCTAAHTFCESRLRKEDLAWLQLTGLSKSSITQTPKYLLEKFNYRNNR